MPKTQSRKDTFINSQGHFVEFAPKISVIGVGGAGGNAVNNMIARQLSGIDYIVCNTDAQHLSTSLCDKRVQMGTSLTEGLGFLLFVFFMIFVFFVCVDGLSFSLL